MTMGLQVLWYVVPFWLTLLGPIAVAGAQTGPGRAADSLQLVQFLFRHGDRTPLYIFPTDKYTSYWMEGLGQLTHIGKEQEYELGKFLRTRYDGFLNLTYNFAEVTVRSTDVDRTLMSAECSMAALYPPTRDEIWNANIKWQPIPVHTVPGFADYLMSSAAPCPVNDKAIEEVMDSTTVQKIEEKYEEFYTFLSEKTGMPVVSFVNASLIYDTLLIEL